jgi:hypothetical protein
MSPSLRAGSIIASVFVAFALLIFLEIITDGTFGTWLIRIIFGGAILFGTLFIAYMGYLDLKHYFERKS